MSGDLHRPDAGTVAAAWVGMMRTKLLAILACSMMSLGVGCAAPSMDSSGDSDTAKDDSSADSDSDAAKEKTIKNTHAFRVAATDDTRDALGISTWHMMVEGDSHSVVVDGSDSEGAVKFSTVIRQPADGAVDVQSFKQAGSFTLTPNGDGTQTAKSSLDADSWAQHTTAFANDWQTNSATQEYSLFDNLGSLLSVFQSTGNIAGTIGSIGTTIQNIQTQFPQITQLAGQLIQQQTGLPAGTVTNAIGAVTSIANGQPNFTSILNTVSGLAGASNTSAVSSITSALSSFLGGSTGTTSTTATQGIGLPSTNLDMGLDTSSIGSLFGSGGGLSFGGDAFAIHRGCLAVSCSKTTKVCVCKKY